MLAVGNPMGERNAPSLGRRRGRRMTWCGCRSRCGPGNSGGALVTARGEVVGIPHLVTGSGVAMAVSTRTVRRFLSDAAPTETAEAGLAWV